MLQGSRNINGVDIWKQGLLLLLSQIRANTIRVQNLPRPMAASMGATKTPSHRLNWGNKLLSSWGGKWLINVHGVVLSLEASLFVRKNFALSLWSQRTLGLILVLSLLGYFYFTNVTKMDNSTYFLFP